MSFKAILYDMDGTLVPMDIKEFTDTYLGYLAKRMVRYGIDPKVFIKAMWAGCESMVRNDGTRTNREVFWETFEAITKVDKEILEPDTDDFYTTDFHKVRSVIRDNPLAKEAVQLSHQIAPIVALATNPLFPMSAQQSRLSWINLTEDDFDLITAYEKDYFCKPNPAYYYSVCERLDVKPEECLMIGNDVDEDMISASSIGMECFLVTDSVIESKTNTWNGRRGTFAELVEYLKGMMKT